ncbi:copper transpport protein [Oleoguttula sp. CCFEE 5521]
MDHSHMNHGDVDMGHGDQPTCSMNMLFTWSTENLCIVFSSWRITSNASLIISLAAIVALTAGYEALREASRRYEMRLEQRVEGMTRQGRSAEEQTGRVFKAAFYGVQVFYSFFIMLLFMTYNGWIMLAVGFGAFLGYLLFGGSSATKSAACH